MNFCTMLRAYTRGGAYLNRQEDVVVSLEVDKEADLVVLDRDITRTQHAVHDAHVLLTVIAGQPVYRARYAPWPVDVRRRKLPASCQN